jgi:hypothetical protein
MPGLDPGIHTGAPQQEQTAAEWIAGSSPAMTTVKIVPPGDYRDRPWEKAT